MALPYRLIHKDNLEMSAFHWLATLAFAPSLAQAHAAHPHEGLWQLHPWLLIPLSLATCLYGLGVLRLWTRRPSPLRMIAFAAALLCLFLALIWPLEALSGQSFAAHMLQHMLLLSVAAPLLVAARPLPVILAALPGRARRLLIRGFARHSSGIWSLITRPGIAFALHALVIWAWHAPPPSSGRCATTPSTSWSTCAFCSPLTCSGGACCTGAAAACSAMEPTPCGFCRP